MLNKITTKDTLFNKFIYGQIFSQIGENMSKVSLVWLVMAISHNNNLVLSFFVTMQALPPLLFGWIYGHIIDEISSRRLLLFVADMFRGIIFSLIPLFYFFHILTTPLLLLLAFIAAISSGIFGPTMFSVIPTFSEDAGPFVKRNSLINITGHIGILIGPFLGGILASIFNPAIIVIITGLTFIISAIFMGLIINNQLNSYLFKIKTYKDFFLEIFTSIKSIKTPYILFKNNAFFSWNLSTTTRLFCLMSLLVGISIGISITAIPIYVKTTLFNGPAVLGIILTSGGAGMLLMSYLLGKSKQEFGLLKEETLSIQEIWLTSALFTSGCLMIPLGLIKNYILLSFLVFLTSGFADVYHPVINTEIQTSVLEKDTGKALTSIGSFFLVGIISGSFISSYLAYKSGLFIAFIVSGSTIILASLIPMILRTKREYYSVSESK